MTLTLPALDLPQVADRLPVLAAQPPAWPADAIAELASTFRMSGTATDLGLWQLVDDGRSTLEIFQASQSFRYARSNDDSELDRAARHGLAADDVSSIAGGWLERIAPTDAAVTLHSIAEDEVLVSQRPNHEPRRLVTATQVSYRFHVDAIPVLGPGAKLQVSISPAGELTGCYCFWRDVRPVADIATVAPEHAIRRFLDSPLFSGLDDRRARVRVDSMRHGYLALPPTEPQRALVPVYEVRGLLETDARPAYEFIRYLAAADEAAAGRWFRPRPGLVCA